MCLNHAAKESESANYRVHDRLATLIIGIIAVNTRIVLKILDLSVFQQFLAAAIGLSLLISERDLQRGIIRCQTLHDFFLIFSFLMNVYNADQIPMHKKR